MTLQERIRGALGNTGRVLPDHVIEDLSQAMLHRVNADAFLLGHERFTAAVADTLTKIIT